MVSQEQTTSLGKFLEGEKVNNYKTILHLMLPIEGRMMMHASHDFNREGGILLNWFAKARSSFSISVICTALLLFGISGAWAQKKQRVSFKTSSENTKYTQQHAIDVGDMAGHKIRIFEVHRTYPKDPPMFDGLRLKAVWRRGYSDYVYVNGRAWGYDIYVLENGDKIFLEWSGTSSTADDPEPCKKSSFVGVLKITGGTGKFLGIRGLLKEQVIFSPKTGYNEAQTEGEYSIER